MRKIEWGSFSPEDVNFLQQEDSMIKINGAYLDRSNIVAERMLKSIPPITDPYVIIKTIDVESSDGKTHIAVFNPNSVDETKAVIKEPQILDENSYHLMNVEAGIGLFAINNLRSLVPNFMQVLGLIRDGPKDVKIVLEYVEGLMLSEFVLSCSIEEFKSILLQLFNALHVASHLYKFTHGGLHYNNVIVRRINHKIEIPIYDENLSVMGTLLTDLVPVIIDYGKSSITINGFTLADDIENVGDDHIFDYSCLLTRRPLPKHPGIYVSYLRQAILDPLTFMVERYTGKICNDYTLGEFLEQIRKEGVFNEQEIQRGIERYRSINAFLFVKEIFV